MKYSLLQFLADYPDEATCLREVFVDRYSQLDVCPSCKAETIFYRVTKRKCFACKYCGYQIYPLAHTIFHKSRTPLRLWFYAIYLFSTSRNGVAASELQRQLGVTYKTAWRMAKQIRYLMAQQSELLSGVVEADEAYIGGRRRSTTRGKDKIPVLGVVERKGRARVVVTDVASAVRVTDFLRNSVEPGSVLNTDESPLYKRSERFYKRESTKHSQYEFVRDQTYTNTIEGFWGQLKRSLSGTHHCVSKKYLQSYVNEFVFRYNYRSSGIYPELMRRAVKPV